MTAGRHLGDLAAALVDDVLTGSARERVLTHLRDCECCRADVSRQQQLKALLSTAGRPALAPDLRATLLSMGEPMTVVPADQMPADTAARPDRMHPDPALDAEPDAHSSARPHGRRRFVGRFPMMMVAAGGVGTLAAGLALGASAPTAAAQGPLATAGVVRSGAVLGPDAALNRRSA